MAPFVQTTKRGKKAWQALTAEGCRLVAGERWASALQEQHGKLQEVEEADRRENGLVMVIIFSSMSSQYKVNAFIRGKRRMSREKSQPNLFLIYLEINQSVNK